MMNFTNEQRDALKELLFKIADDALILGHRNSEWVGIGPLLEEDIAFASIAQDQLGHALALYTILHDHLGESDPDTLAFMRAEPLFKCSHFVEIPTQEYDTALVRHFLYDTASALRFEALTKSHFEPLKNVARKVRGEIAYHTMHANVWMKQLGRANEESHARMQTALNELYPLALGMFEPSKNESALRRAEIFIGEEALQEQWTAAVQTVTEQAGLKLPTNAEPALGGRFGYHTEFLQPLLHEMSEVFVIDPNAEW